MQQSCDLFKWEKILLQHPCVLLSLAQLVLPRAVRVHVQEVVPLLVRPTLAVVGARAAQVRHFGAGFVRAWAGREGEEDEEERKKKVRKKKCLHLSFASPLVYAKNQVSSLQSSVQDHR